MTLEVSGKIDVNKFSDEALLKLTRDTLESMITTSRSINRAYEAMDSVGENDLCIYGIQSDIDYLISIEQSYKKTYNFLLSIIQERNLNELPARRRYNDYDE